MCGKKIGEKGKDDTWWCNEEVKQAISRKKDAHRLMCGNSTKNKKAY